VGMIEDVYTFQTKVLGHDFPDKPTVLKGETKSDLVYRVLEELNEFIVADTIEDQADALGDAIYFLLGGAHRAGLDFQRVWDEIQRANMDKAKGKTKRGSEDDAAKPSDWKEPDHSWLSKAA